MECETAHALIDQGRLEEETGPHASRNGLQISTLLDTIERHGFDACLGGGRRDEETKTDIGRYIRQEQIPLPSLYFADVRDCLMRAGSLLAVSELVRRSRSPPKPNAGTVPTTSSPKRQWKTANARATYESVERTKLDFSQSLLQEPLFRSVGGQRECTQIGLLRLTSSAGASIETCPGGMRRFGATEIVDQRLGQSQPPPSKNWPPVDTSAGSEPAHSPSLHQDLSQPS